MTVHCLSLTVHYELEPFLDLSLPFLDLSLPFLDLSLPFVDLPFVFPFYLVSFALIATLSFRDKKK